MVTKELIKKQVDRVQEEYLEALYKIVVAFGRGPDRSQDLGAEDVVGPWADFVQETYGSLADDPIERGPQGSYESRERLT
jgi:hypothetical protein